MGRGFPNVTRRDNASGGVWCPSLKKMASEKQFADQGTGMTRMLWHLAISDKPLTERELANKMGLDKKDIHAIKLYKRGFAIRRRRPTDEMGQNPYEYTVRPRQGLDDDAE